MNLDFRPTIACVVAQLDYLNCRVSARDGFARRFVGPLSRGNFQAWLSA